MGYAPFRAKTQTYKGTTFGYSFTIKEDGSALDLTTLTKIEVALFKPGKTIFLHSTDGSDPDSDYTLVISGTDDNIVSGVASESTMDIGLRTYNMELRLYFADGSKEVYSVIENEIIGPDSDESQGAHDWVLDIDNDSETVSGQVTSLYAETVDLNQDTEILRDETQTLKDQTETLFDNFDDRYLGAKSSDPSTDNDGDPLQDGALYFNTSNNIMRVYDGSNWNDLVAGLTNTVDESNTTEAVTGKAVGDYTNISHIHSQIVKPEHVFGYDDFNKSDQTGWGEMSSGQAWTVQRGNAEIVDKAGYTFNTSTNDRSLITYPTTNAAGVFQRAFIQSPSSGGLHGFILAYIDNDNYLEVVSGEGSMVLFKTVNSTKTKLEENFFSFSARKRLLYLDATISLDGYAISCVGAESSVTYDAGNDTDVQNIIDNSIALGISGSIFTTARKTILNYMAIS